MNEEQLLHLEQQVDTLISAKRQLQEQNDTLQQRVAKLTQERATLLEQHKIASNKVRSVIARLEEGIL